MPERSWKKELIATLNELALGRRERRRYIQAAERLSEAKAREIVEEIDHTLDHRPLSVDVLERIVKEGPKCPL